MWQKKLCFKREPKLKFIKETPPPLIESKWHNFPGIFRLAPPRARYKIHSVELIHFINGKEASRA